MQSRIHRMPALCKSRVFISPDFGKIILPRWRLPCVAENDFGAASVENAFRRRRDAVLDRHAGLDLAPSLASIERRAAFAAAVAPFQQASLLGPV